MIVRGLDAACAMVGYPANHGRIFQQVADQLDTIILGREVGSACTGLIEEGYALKGFRVDTKSCDWGPMRGFVCTDPRLNKEGTAKVAFNREYTGHAMSGHVDAAYTGHEHITHAHLQTEWVAGYKPIIISQGRVDALTAGNHIAPTATDGGHLVGRNTKGGVELRWRLIPVRDVIKFRESAGANKAVETLYAATPNKDGEHYLLCVNRFGDTPWQESVGGIASISVTVARQRFEVVQGLTNPGTDALGFKACVTGDYDLFGVWPRVRQLNALPRPSAHQLNTSPLARSPAAIGSGFPQGRFVAPQLADARPLDRAGGKEHFQLGNISNRVKVVKTLLNTQLQFRFGADFKGGQCVHHSDEVGNPNPALQKTLDKSMPVVAFVPTSGGIVLRTPWGISTVVDFYSFAVKCYVGGFFVQLRENWKPAFFQACAAQGLDNPPSPPY